MLLARECWGLRLGTCKLKAGCCSQAHQPIATKPKPSLLTSKGWCFLFGISWSFRPGSSPCLQDRAGLRIGSSDSKRQLTTRTPRNHFFWDLNSSAWAQAFPHSRRSACRVGEWQSKICELKRDKDGQERSCSSVNRESGYFLLKTCMQNISILCACHSPLPVQICWHAQTTIPALYGCRHGEPMAPPYMHASSHLLGRHVNVILSDWIYWPILLISQFTKQNCRKSMESQDLVYTANAGPVIDLQPSIGPNWTTKI